MAETSTSNPYAVDRTAFVLDNLADFLLDIHLRLIRSEARDGIIDQGARAIADRGTKYIEATVLPLVSEVAAAIADYRDGVSADRVRETADRRFLSPATLAELAALDSPALHGLPTAPTAAEGDASELIATTAFVGRGLDALAEIIAAQLATRAPKLSPSFEGTPLAPTAPAGTNTGQLATTAFVQAVAAVLAGNLADGLSGLRDGAPANLDTLDKLAAAIGDDPSFVQTVNDAFGRRLRFDQQVTLTAAQQQNARLNINAQTALGFTPVTQNVGTNMGNSRLYMGWGTGSRLYAQVDSVSLGYLWLERDVSMNSGNNGYINLPNGLILQWGTLAAGTADAVVTFPTAFPTRCMTVVATSAGAPPNTTMCGLTTDQIGTTSFAIRRRQVDSGGNVYAPNPGAATRWFAVGI